MGHVLSVEQEGKSVEIESSSGCSAVPGDALYVQSDTTIIDSFTDNGGIMSEMTVLSLFADSEVECDSLMVLHEAHLVSTTAYRRKISKMK